MIRFVVILWNRRDTTFATHDKRSNLCATIGAPLFRGALGQGLVVAAGLVRGIIGITRVHARVFAAEYDEGVPGTGDPIRVTLTIPNGATVRGGKGWTIRICMKAIDGGVRGRRGILNGRETVRMGII